MHLAVDVAHTSLTAEQAEAERYVSRSRKQAVYHAARAEMEQLLHMVDDDGSDGEDASLPLLLDWDALYADDGFEPFDDGGFGGFGHGFGHEHDREREPVPMEERAVTLHRFGKRLSGLTFSPGGAISMVIYDKVLQSRMSGKRHMEPLWQAAGWQPGVPVTRHEARLRRQAIHELGLPGEVRACLDDPWEFLDYKGAVFAAVVGHTGHAGACPDAVDVAWIRRVVPDAHDTNRSRWPTDPVWQVVQGATFANAPAEARRLIRRRQRAAAVAALDTGQFGYLVSRVAQLHPNGGQWTLSRALGEALPALEAVEAKKQAQTGMDFGELVRERRRQRGLPLPFAEKVLPFRPTGNGGVASDEIAGDGEARVAQAWSALEAAEKAGRSRRALRELEEAYLAELQAYQEGNRPPSAVDLQAP